MATHLCKANPPWPRACSQTRGPGARGGTRQPHTLLLPAFICTQVALLGCPQHGGARARHLVHFLGASWCLEHGRHQGSASLQPCFWGLGAGGRGRRERSTHACREVFGFLAGPCGFQKPSTERWLHLGECKEVVVSMAARPGPGGTPFLCKLAPWSRLCFGKQLHKLLQQLN